MYFSEHTMHVLHFWAELQNAEVSVTLLRSDSTTDTFPESFIFEQTKETLAVESAFGTVKGGWIGQPKFIQKRDATKDVFIIFLKLS